MKHVQQMKTSAKLSKTAKNNETEALQHIPPKFPHASFLFQTECTDSLKLHKNSLN